MIKEKIISLFQSKIVKDFSLVIISRFINAFLFLLFTFFMMSVLSVENYGEFSFFYSIASVVPFFLNLGIDASLIAITSKIDNHDKYLNYLGLYWRLKFILIGVGVLISFVYLSFVGNELVFLSLLAGITFGFSDCFKAPAEARKMFNFVSLTLPLRNTFLLLLCFFLYWLGYDNVYVFIYCMISANVLRIVFIYVLYVRKIAPLVLKTTLKFGDLFVFLKWIFTKDLLITIVAQLEILILGQLVLHNIVSKAELGYYSGAFTLSMVLSLVTNSLTSILLPEVAGKDDVKSLQSFILKLFKSMLFVVPVCILFYFIITAFVHFGYGEKYEASIPLFPIIILGTIFAFYANNISLIFYRKDRLFFLVLITFLKLVLGVVLSLIFIPIYGSWGAAISFLIVRIFDFIAVAIKSRISLYNKSISTY